MRSGDHSPVSLHTKSTTYIIKHVGGFCFVPGFVRKWNVYGRIYNKHLMASDLLLKCSGKD